VADDDERGQRVLAPISISESRPNPASATDRAASAALADPDRRSRTLAYHPCAHPGNNDPDAIAA
jgi:hypothetical protein